MGKLREILQHGFGFHDSQWDGKLQWTDFITLNPAPWINGLWGKDRTTNEDGTHAGFTDKIGGLIDDGTKEIKSFINGEEKTQEQPQEQPQQPQEPTMPSIQDGTNNNIEQAITGQGGQGILDWIEKQQKEQIALQEKWRQQDFERQDNAWQRAVADMRKAGVNPNLVNAQPAESGSSTSQPAEKNFTIFSEYMEKILLDLDKEAEEEKIPLESITQITKSIQNIMVILKLLGKI